MDPEVYNAYSGLDYGAFPAIRWKLFNIEKLKANNPHKYQEQVELLRQALGL